ncbi:AraC family transcriptional regulator [Roseovarius sp. SCSIO 43702]|uniref:AraC family transcriptional regulator n=1 Tax=Roseovarius sp. SCSIO 43702 TaxID=2823043 RepID=UPI0021761D57|nr:AraC family transcriptional regulator [Roseovarius sp. SCSIO 43702]
MAQPVSIRTLAQWSRGADWRLALPHAEAEHALVWITRGQARILLDGVQRGLGVHNAVAIPAGSVFGLTPGPHCFGWVATIAPRGPIMMPDTAQVLRILEAHNQAELTGLLEAMQRETNRGLPFADEALAAHAALVTVWLRRMMIDHPMPTRPSAAARLVAAYSALVERDFRLPRVMADYAAELGVTPTHLTRACRQSAGLTAGELLVRRTLHAARLALEDGEMPVAHVAASLGFGSAAYFSRFIQHHTGKTPTALRKAARAPRIGL